MLLTVFIRWDRIRVGCCALHSSVMVTSNRSVNSAGVLVQGLVAVTLVVRVGVELALDLVHVFLGRLSTHNLLLYFQITIFLFVLAQIIFLRYFRTVLTLSEFRTSQLGCVGGLLRSLLLLRLTL